MWTDGNRRTAVVGRGAGEHVDNARFSVRRLDFVRSHIRAPLTRRLVRTRCWTARNLGVARLAREPVAPFAQNHPLALRIGTDDSGGAGKVLWTRSYRPRHLDFCRVTRNTATLINVHETGTVRQLHLRSDRT